MDVRLGKMVDVMERSLANLNEQITALENNSIRSGRNRSPELLPEREEKDFVVPERYSKHDEAPRELSGRRSGQPSGETVPPEQCDDSRSEQGNK